MTRNAPEKEYFGSFFKGNHFLFALTIGLQMASGFFQVGCSWLLGAVTDCMTAGDRDGLIRIAVITVAALPVVALIIWLASWIQARFNRRAMSQYKALAYERISAKGISAFSRENTGRYLSALTNDISSIEKQYLPYIPSMVEQIFGFMLAMGVMLYCSPMLTLVLIGACALPLVVSIAMSGKYAELEQQVSAENETYTGRIKDLLSGFSVIKSFKAESETRQLFSDSSNAVEQRKERQKRFSGIVNAMSTAASLVAQLGTFVVGAFMAVRGDITAGTVLLFVNLCNSVLSPIQSVPTYWAGIKASRALIRKLAGLTQENTGRSGLAIEPVLENAIAVDGLSFSYEEGKPVLTDVSLTLERGKKYALVGSSGSGKSTLLNLLMGAYDSYDGAISIDGQELRQVDPDSLYDLMSLIGQSVFLFDSTIRENITMFRTFPDDQVDSAVERSGLAAVIAAKGEDYRCGENGAGLSGGERQRVSIARALLRNTPVLMLDEATAALDNQTAFEVTDAILRLEGLTRIVVTHRLEEALLCRYDQIIVLRDGRVVEQGTYEQLMAKTGYFYSLYHVAN